MIKITGIKCSEVRKYENVQYVELISPFNASLIGEKVDIHMQKQLEIEFGRKIVSRIEEEHNE